MFTKVEEAVEKDEKKPSVAKSAAKGAVVGGVAGKIAGAVRKSNLAKDPTSRYSKSMDKGAKNMIQKSFNAAGKASDQGKGLIDTLSKSAQAAKTSRGARHMKNVAGKIKYGGKWGRIGMGTGAVALGTAAALKARRDKKNKAA